jgi:hypothetical protein
MTQPGSTLNCARTLNSLKTVMTSRFLVHVDPRVGPQLLLENLAEVRRVKWDPENSTMDGVSYDAGELLLGIKAPVPTLTTSILSH